MKSTEQSNTNLPGRVSLIIYPKSRYRLLLCCLLVVVFFVPGNARALTPYRISILTLGEVRQNALNGFKDAMYEYGRTNKIEFIYDVKDGGNDRHHLPQLANDIVNEKPDLAIAAGGVEADALRIATAESNIPVVFLVVSSSVSRGLAVNMQRPGGNLTGIDTNDTALTGKRLWYITKLFPEVRRVLCFNVPSITPSADSIKIAREVAPQFNLDLTVIDIVSASEIAAATANISKENTDAILLNPCAPVSQSVKSILLPLSLREHIPILGYSEGDIANGAVAAYGPSRYGIGKQGARLAIKVLQGTSPSILPIEPPEELELIINRHMVDRLGLQLPDKVWRIADSVVDVEQ